ncbi:MAG: lysozyme inhibitor LprI family protein [Hyphomicrobiaceae bacterium]
MSNLMRCLRGDSLIALALSMLVGATICEADVLGCARRIVERASERCSRDVQSVGGTIGSHAYCIEEAEIAEGKRLQRIYDERIKRSSVQLRRALRDAQRAWLKYQTKNCAYEAITGRIKEGPPLDRAWKASCLLLTTAYRTCEIETLNQYFTPDFPR